MSDLDNFRVVIADDHPPSLAGIAAALEAADVEVCAAVRSSDEAIASVREHKPDVALLEVLLPGDGLRAAATIAEEVPETAIVMLTSSRDDRHLLDALAAGARGYLLKDTNPERLPQALRGVLKGEAAIPRELVARLAAELRRREVAGTSGVLTPREREVMAALKAGATTKQVAQQIGLAEGTVRGHASRAARKLGAGSVRQAVRDSKG